MTVITRFAPSPTGFLHIGGARTALFNWLFARHHGGKFLLRIEDTDRARSTEAAVAAIFSSLQWLGMDWDEEPVFQFSRAKRHAAVAHALLEKGLAYRCYCTPHELERMREEARAAGQPPRYNGLWRDRLPEEGPLDQPSAVRLKAPRTGVTAIEDQVQGHVQVSNEELDDMVLLRSDGTPTYMLSVVVDDHDMEITHIIRGDDHLTNAFRQLQIYQAMGWTPPVFSHIPLIHGADGAKLSKRHGALGTDSYQEMGFLPEALFNYLLRLGWSHGDDEIISRQQAVTWFDLKSVGKAPARLDLAKLTHLNAHYIKEMPDDLLLEALRPLLSSPLTVQAAQRLLAGMPGLKVRAKTLLELRDSALFYTYDRPIPLSEAAQKLLEGFAPPVWQALLAQLAQVDKTQWDAPTLEQQVKAFAEEKGLKLGQVAQPMRAALTGSHISPSVFDVMAVLGQEESLGRLRDVRVNTFSTTTG